jgi:hypothetical protein
MSLDGSASRITRSARRPASSVPRSERPRSSAAFDGCEARLHHQGQFAVLGDAGNALGCRAAVGAEPDPHAGVGETLQIGQIHRQRIPGGLRLGARARLALPRRIVEPGLQIGGQRRPDERGLRPGRGVRIDERRLVEGECRDVPRVLRLEQRDQVGIDGLVAHAVGQHIHTGLGDRTRILQVVDMRRDPQAEPVRLVDHRLVDRRLHLGRHGPAEIVEPEFHHVGAAPLHRADGLAALFGIGGTEELIRAHADHRLGRAPVRYADAAIDPEQVGAGDPARMRLGADLRHDRAVEPERHDRGDAPVGIGLELGEDVLARVVPGADIDALDDADMGVVGDQPRHDRAAAHLPDLGIGRDRDRGARSCRDDAVAVDDHHGVLDRLGRSTVDQPDSREGQRFRDGAAEATETETHGSRHNRQ